MAALTALRGWPSILRSRVGDHRPGCRLERAISSRRGVSGEASKMHAVMGVQEQQAKKSSACEPLKDLSARALLLLTEACAREAHTHESSNAERHIPRSDSGTREPFNFRLNNAHLVACGLLLAATCVQTAEPAHAADIMDKLDSAAATSNQSYPSTLGSVMDLAEGPFWDNVARFVVYFITVFTGGLFTLLKPIYDLAKNPFTLFLLVAVLGGGFFLTYLTLSSMLGLNEIDFEPYSTSP